MTSSASACNRKSTRRSLALCSAFAVLPLLAGCAAYHAMPFVENRSASSIVEHREREGLHVAARDLSEPGTSRKHFSRSLLEYGYVPVMLLAEIDARSSDAFNIRRNELHLVLRDGTRLKSVHPARVIEAVGFSHWRSFVGYLFLLPGPFVSSSVSSANEQLEADYLQKSLRSVRLSPNMRSFQGAVFFEVPEESMAHFTMEDAFIEFVVYKEGNTLEGTGIGRRLDFPVHFSE